jgi:FMN phosphatase YigB (HAD superfamily)
LDQFVVARVHSFDVFDTSLIRKIASPPDVFRLMGNLIAQKIRPAYQGDFTEDFLAARIRAERMARSHSEETTLDQIWVNLREIMPELPTTFGPQDELDAERNLLLPNSIVAKQITRWRSEGARIIFTSDTYFPEEFVREQLLRHGLAETGDGIYVSSTAGVTKRTGGLFKTILNREGIVARDLHHCGDDPHSDVVMPRRLGIGATLLTNSRLTTWENALLSKHVQYRMATSLLAGSMRAFRLSAIFQSNGADELVASILGPALMVWAAWVLSTAQRDGVRRLYFVSRDAYLLCGAARVLASHFGDIDCRHLRISRQSIWLPSIDEISPSKMPWLRRHWKPVLLKYLLTKLGLNWTDVAPHFSSLAGRQEELKLMTTESEWDEFWNIIQNPPVADLLREQIQYKRENALEYLRAEGLCDKVPAAIVDVGWFVSVQTCLLKLLVGGGRTSTPRGYYLGLCHWRMPPADAGKVTALFYEQAPYHHWVLPQYEIFRRIDVLDNLFGLAPYGSVSDYKINGSIVEPVGPPETTSHAEFVGKLGDAIEAFCKNNHQDALYYSDTATAREIIDSLVSAWCIHPNKAAFKALDHVMVIDGTDAIPSQPLLKSWRLFDAAKTLIPARLREKLKISVPNPVWPEVAYYRSGVLAKSILRLSGALRLIKGALRSRLLSLRE